MAKINKHAWLEGALVGAAIGISAALLAKSDLGKKLSKDAKHSLADFLKYLAPRLKKAKKMGETEYKALVREAMQQYSKNKKLSQNEIARLIKEAQATWAHVKKHF